MKTKKIRGHKRHWTNVENWIEYNKHLNIDDLKNYPKDYVKIRVHPWSGVSLVNSAIPEPRRETRKRILSGLIEIYDSWKIALDKLEEPYYLELWLFEQNFSNSQVVCAMGEYIDFYNNTFYKPDSSKRFVPQNYGQLANEMDKFAWEYRIDEEHFDNTEPGTPDLYASMEDYGQSKKYFDKMFKKPHRTTKFEEPTDEITEYYSFKKGNVWLGHK